MSLPFKSFLGIEEVRSGGKKLLAGPYYGATIEEAQANADRHKSLAERWGEENVRDWGFKYAFNDWVMFNVSFASETDPGQVAVAGVLDFPLPEPEKTKRTRKAKAPREVTSYRHTVPAF